MGAGDRDIELVAFDLDGTLLRGVTVCEAIARQLGRGERMEELEQVHTTEEILQSREEMASWYEPYSVAELATPLPEMDLAPGTREAFDRLADHDVTTAIVSLTWEFAVEYFAEELGADHYVGTTLHPDGDITHVLPADKPTWIRGLTERQEIEMEQVASVGDTANDAHMLAATGRAYFVGSDLPDGLESVRHRPDADISELVEDLLGGP